MMVCRSNNSKSGQVALVVLLVSAVVMTIGLSMSKTAVIETKIDTDEESLKQAFNAAESGIEYYLGTGSTKYQSIDGESVADLSIKNLGNGTTVNFNQYVLSENDVQYWLVGHNTDGSINFSSYYTGNSLNVCVPSGFAGALKVDYFYRNGINYEVMRWGYNFGVNTVNGYVNLSPLPTQEGCVSGYRSLSIPATLGGVNVPLLLSVRPIGGGGKIYLLGSGATFPVQGVSISSVGKVSSGVNRQITVLQTYKVPSFLVDGVVSFGGVSSN